jgi:hypothetical protein
MRETLSMTGEMIGLIPAGGQFANPITETRESANIRVRFFFSGIFPTDCA